MKKLHSFGTVGIAILLSICLLTAGCSTAWVKIAINDAPVVLQIVVSILSIVDVKAVPAAQSAGAQAQADLQLLQKYLADYKTAQTNSTEQVAALKNIQAALSAASGDINAILTAVHISDPAKQRAVVDGLNVALTVIAAVEALVPQPATPTPAALARAKGGSSAPALLKPSEVKRTFNLLIGQQYPSAVIN